MYSFPTDLQTRTEHLLSEKCFAEKFGPGHCFFDVGLILPAIFISVNTFSKNILIEHLRPVFPLFVLCRQFFLRGRKRFGQFRQRVRIDRLRDLRLNHRDRRFRAGDFLLERRDFFRRLRCRAERIRRAR